MLVERERALAGIEKLPPVRRTPVPVNLELEDPADALLAVEGFDSRLPTFLVFEGTSMYLEAEVNARTLRSLHRLMGHPESRLWVDVVAGSVVDDSSADPAVQRFLEAMAPAGRAVCVWPGQRRPLLADLGY